jgi:hypothetical protein
MKKGILSMDFVAAMAVNNYTVLLKRIQCILVILFFSACSESNMNFILVPLDLMNQIETIRYSQFVDSIGYITLNTNDSCMISGIEKIFIDEDTIIIHDTNRGGIFVFTANGNFVKQINNYGNGPGEFVSITSFTIDPKSNHLYVYDMARQINKYTYQGDYIKSYKTDIYARDFLFFEPDNYLFIIPTYAKNYPSGVILTDTNNVIIKNMKDDVPKDDQFEYIGNYCNLSGEGIYYYDRNQDDFSYITKNSLVPIYQFDLKQRIPNSVRIKPDWNEKDVAEYSIMSSFCHSTNFLSITYYTFGDDTPYKWVFVDKKNREVIVSKCLINDVDDTASSFSQLYYINDKIWCRIVDSEENDCNVYLQILYLKDRIENIER